LGTFLKMLNIEFNDIDEQDLYEPDSDYRPGDEKVGDLNDHLIRLYSLWKVTERVSQEKTIEANFFRGSEADKKLIHDKSLELASKSFILESIFWHEVREEIKVWGKSYIGVRKGRAIVKQEIHQAIKFFPLTHD
jgi:hypothetical protein